MRKQELAIELIKEKTGKDGKCTLSKHKLADVLLHKYPTEFKDKEHARSIIRRVTGANGKRDRKKLKLVTEWKGLSLPEPEKNDYSKFLIKEKRIGILSDIHFPYYDKEALNAAIAYLRKWKPDCILLNGDIIDCYQISSFLKDARKPKFKEEVALLQMFFDQLRVTFPKANIIFKLGNHEQRYETIILQRLPEFIDLKWTRFESVIEADAHGIQVVKNKRIMKAGKLNILHGHELPHGIAAPVNPARGFFLKTKANVLGGHHHQTSDHSEADINGNIIGAWSTGCLCELHPDYAPINKWNHGFATVENFGLDFKVTNLRIIKGKVM